MAEVDSLLSTLEEQVKKSLDDLQVELAEGVNIVQVVDFLVDQMKYERVQDSELINELKATSKARVVSEEPVRRSPVKNTEAQHHLAELRR